MPAVWHLNCSFTHLNFDLFQEKKSGSELGLFFGCFVSTVRGSAGKVVMKKVSILLILFIFGSFVRAWCDPVKSIEDAAVQLTTMKVDTNKAILQKKTEPAKESAGWMKRSQDRLRNVDFLGILEEKKKSPWVTSSDWVISSVEFSANAWKNKFSSVLQAGEIKPSISDSEKSVLKSYPDRNGSSEEGKILTTLKLLGSKEETFKQLFMGLGFSYDLTSGHMFLEVNVTPPTETTRSGFMIRF